MRKEIMVQKQVDFYKNFYSEKPSPVSGVYKLDRYRYASLIQDPVRTPMVFEKGMKLLHVGCGTNSIAQFLEDYEVFGFDVSLDGLKKGKDIGYSSENVCASAEERFPFIDELFDFVFGVTVMSHVEDWKNYVSEMVRVAKHGGAIGEITQNKKARLWNTKIYKKLIKERILKFPEPEDIESLMKSFGVDDIRITTWDRLLHRFILHFLPEWFWKGFVDIDREKVRKQFIRPKDMYYYVAGRKP